METPNSGTIGILLKDELQKKSPSEQVTVAVVDAEGVSRGDGRARGEERWI